MKIPTGCMFTHVICSSGKRMTYQNADVDCAFAAALCTDFCNWRIDLTYADTNACAAHQRQDARPPETGTSEIGGGPQGHAQTGDRHGQRGKGARSAEAADRLSANRARLLQILDREGPVKQLASGNRSQTIYRGAGQH